MAAMLSVGYSLLTYEIPTVGLTNCAVSVRLSSGSLQSSTVMIIGV